jgi:hypothetical protein
MIVPGLGHPVDFVVRRQLSALLGAVNRGILHLGMVTVWSTMGLWADFPFQRTQKGILGIQVFYFLGEVVGMTLAPVWGLMGLGRSVAEAIGGMVGVEVAGGEGVIKMLEVLVGGFGPKVAAGFRVLEAFGYRYYEVLLGSLVLVPEVG